jgi:hypothetical protein
VEITRNIRSDQLIPGFNMPRKKVSTVESLTILEHDTTPSNTSVNRIPQAGPIFRLPLEIRRIIYNLVIGERVQHVGHEGKILFKRSNSRPLGFSPQLRRNTRKAVQDTRKAAQELLKFRTKPSPLAIAATCQQLYQEAGRVWYENVRFIFHSIPCTVAFLDDIGKSNYNAIRHASCNVRFGPEDKVTMVILDTVSHFPGLRHLTLEDAGKSIRLQDLNSDFEIGDDKALLERWHGWAQTMLRLENRLESVTLTIKTTTLRRTNHVFESTWTREYRELKLNSSTGEIQTTSSLAKLQKCTLDRSEVQALIFA